MRRTTPGSHRSAVLHRAAAQLYLYIKALGAFGASDSVFAGLFWESQNSFAVRALLENVSLSVAYLISCESEFAFNCTYDLFEFSVFSASLVDIL